MLKTPYRNIIDIDAIGSGSFQHPNQAVDLASHEQTRDVKDDEQKVLLIGIDWQNDFVLPAQSEDDPRGPYGSLSVPGAAGDIER